MANATPTPGNTGAISLLDIISPESAAALTAMIDNSPEHTYIKPDLSDVNLLKVSVMDGNNDCVVAHMEVATNAYAAIYKKAMYSEISQEPTAQATDQLLDKSCAISPENHDSSHVVSPFEP